MLNRYVGRCIAVICLLIGFLNIQAQDTLSDLRIGEWRQHLPWQRGIYVTQNAEKVWFATDFAVVELDKTDRSTHYYTKVEGLSDVGIKLMRYNPATKNILIAYTNSNLDVLNPENGEVSNLPFIQKNTSLGGAKSLNSITFYGKDAFICASFGVVKLNLETLETDFTLFTGSLPVRGFEIYDGHYWMGTDEGVFYLPIDDENPADFGRWKSPGIAAGFPNDLKVTAMTVFDGHIWFGAFENLYRYATGGILTPTTSQPDREPRFLEGSGVDMIVGWRNNFGGAVQAVEKGTYFGFEVHWGCEGGLPLYAVEDGRFKYWMADQADFFRYYDYQTNTCERIAFNSPYEQVATEINIARGKVFVSTPGAQSNLSPRFAATGAYIYDEGEWTRFSQISNPEIKTGDCQFDMWRIAGHPSQEKFYVGSFIGGLIEASDDLDSTRCYTKNNSILKDAGPAGTQRTAIGGMTFDEDENLWICNYSSVAPIAVLKSDGVLKNFTAAPANNLLQVAVDQNGYKWFVVGFNGGVMVYDSGKDLDNPADDRYRLINTGNSNLPTNTVNTIAVDLDGDVWVGTLQGVVTFECGSNVFDSDCKGRRRIVSVDGFNAYLLETEDVKTIAIDGANRKWFGTTNGIFVQSADGLTQEARFTNTNSPLFDNIVTDIAINPKNGEVWIGTEKGLLSLRTDATSGGKVNTKTAYAYPNPVKPDYDGPIAIYGLARDANIKITDISGHLVYEGKALGGQAVWDGRDYLGHRAASGVYLVYATSQTTFESPDAIITKVVILN